MTQSFDLDFYSTGLYDHEIYSTFDHGGIYDTNRDLESLIEQRRYEEENCVELRKRFAEETEKRRKIDEEKERLFELEQIEIAKQKEINRANKLKELKEQIGKTHCGNYNSENDTFTDPISFEEISTEDGIILDTQLYSIASMLIWTQERSIVPHSRRKLSVLEREVIGCTELRERDDSNSYDYDGYISIFDSETDSDYDFRPSPPRRLYGIDRRMSWHEFVSFIQNLPSFFSNHIIDSISNEEIMIDEHIITITIRRRYQDESGVPQNIFDIHINAYDRNLYQRVNDTGVDSIFLRRVKSLILSRGLARDI
jgi:hypothetical protein